MMSDLHRPLRDSVSYGVLALSLALPGAAQAATYTVTDQASLVAAINSANADGDPSSTITLANNFTIAGNSLPGVTKTLTIDTGPYKLTGSQDTILNVAAGSELTVHGSIGVTGNPGFYGRLIKSGAGTLNLTGGVSNVVWYVRNDQGDLVIKDGAHVTMDSRTGPTGSLTNSQSSATVTGVGTLVTDVGGTFVGAVGGATLTIEGGAHYVNGSPLQVASATNSTGDVNVTGAGSLLQGPIIISRGRGEINVTDGAHVEGASAVFGGTGNPGGSLAQFLGGSGIVTVSGAGSQWINTSHLLLMDGSLSVLDGGAVQTSILRAAAVTGGAASTADILVSGAGSSLTVTGTAAKSFQLANGTGTGTQNASLTIADGGVVTVAGTIEMATTATSHAVLNIGGAEGQAATGAGTLNAGLIQFGAGTGSVNFNHTDTAYQFGTTIAGGGSVNHNGPGTTIVTANNTYTGGTIISGGTLQLGNGGTTGGLVGNVTDNGTLAFNRSDALTFAGLISGSGAVTQKGPNTLTLTSDNTYAGGTTIAAGTLQLGNGGASGGVAGDIVNNGTLLLNRSNALTLDGLISGSGAIDQIGGGTTVLTGDNSYSGTTTVTSGRLFINGKQSGTGQTTVAGGATLGGFGTIGGSVMVAGGAVLTPGDASMQQGTLGIAGNLVLDAASTTAIQFGKAYAIGGPLNDLVNVGGDLTLAGTLDVTETLGGDFGPGLYRVFNYGGALINGGPMLNAPAGSNVVLQTVVDHQVNLINKTGLEFRYWDRATTNNNEIEGGTGTWLDAAGNVDWTDDNGQVNSNFLNSAFAVFMGDSGTVAVDDNNGADPISVAGMQFVTDGYHIGGDSIFLDDSIVPVAIRVGDGTAAGAATTATVASVLTGTAALHKRDLGTLILSGANSYGGGTAFEGGTLQIARDDNLGAISGGLTFDGGTLQTTADITSARSVTVTGAGAIDAGSGTKLTLTGTLVGTGAMTKTGGGALYLTGDSSAYAGTTSVQSGLLSVNGSLGGTLAVVGGRHHCARQLDRHPDHCWQLHRQ